MLQLKKLVISQQRELFLSKHQFLSSMIILMWSSFTQQASLHWAKFSSICIYLYLHKLCQDVFLFSSKLKFEKLLPGYFQVECVHLPFWGISFIVENWTDESSLFKLVSPLTLTIWLLTLLSCSHTFPFPFAFRVR